MNWLNVKDNYLDHYGFVYCITNLKTGQYYIGKKFFWKQITRKPLKGKRQKRHSLVESDWKTYYGSSNNLKADLEKYGKNNFKREILHYCDNKWDCAYTELMEQMARNVLFQPESYNEIINVRLRKRK